MSKQKSLVQSSLLSMGDGEHSTQAVVDTVLERDRQEFNGEVFHQSKTPRNSVRRTLTELQAKGIVIKDGRGKLIFDIDGIRNCVIEGDVLEVLKMCPDNSIPIVTADPPWSYIQAHLAKGSTTRMMGTSNTFYETQDLPKEVIREIHRVLQPGGVFLCWFPPAQEEAQDTWLQTLTAIRRTGFTMLREVTWVKGKGGGYIFAPSTEPLFVFSKGARPTVSNGRLFDLSVTNVITHPRMHAKHKTRYTDYTAADEQAWKDAVAKYGSNKKIPAEVSSQLRTASHQAEKPQQVMEDILRVFLGAPWPLAAEVAKAKKEGREPEVRMAERDKNLVLDLYSGTGSASEAAKRLGGDFIAVELDARNVEHMVHPRLGGDVEHIIRMKDLVVA